MPPPRRRPPRSGVAGCGTAWRARELDPAAYEAIVKLSREVIERVAWEIVPELAETIIREQLERVLAQRSK
ncbi:MAG: hypothetical protein IPG96_11700 [Proteobacteria bacterium]|nr:hypothetical protein [Pseudomonadota bacterium]